MARLFTDGAEFGDVLFWNVIVDTVATTAQYRSGNYCYQLGSNNNIGASKYIPNLSEFYLRFGWRCNAIHDNILVRWINGGTLQGSLRVDASRYPTLNVGSTLVATGTKQLLINTWYLIEIRVKIDDSTGVLALRVDGANDASFSGDTKPSTPSTVTNLDFYNHNTAFLDDLALNDTTGGSDDSWCGEGKIILLKPNGNGDASDLTGSDGNSTDNYLLVDEVPLDSDTTYVEGSTSGNRDLYALEDFSGAGMTINRVWVEARAKDTVADGGQCKLSIKPSGGSEDKSSAIDLLTSYTNILGTVYTLNPADSAAWEDADLDSLQVGFEVV